MMTCPFCGSVRPQTVGGECGDPFNRRPERTVCLDCGRTTGGRPERMTVRPRRRKSPPV